MTTRFPTSVADSVSARRSSVKRASGACLKRGLCVLILLYGPGSPLASDTAYYYGSISAESNRHFFDSIGTAVPERLIISSTGGDVADGIALGTWIFRNAVDVEVDRVCLSSCANYVFPAGRNKFIRQGAIVAWHGNYHHLLETGLWMDDVEVRVQRGKEDRETAERYVKAEVARLVRLESTFFSEIGVDEKLCWIGKTPPHEVPNYFFLSQRDMNRFGLSSINVPADYENTDVSRFSMPIQFIRLRLPEPTR